MERLVNDIMNLNDLIVQLEREKLKIENRYNQFDAEHKSLAESSGKQHLINGIRKEKETLRQVLQEIQKKLSKF